MHFSYITTFIHLFDDILLASVRKLVTWIFEGVGYNKLPSATPYLLKIECVDWLLTLQILKTGDPKVLFLDRALKLAHVRHWYSDLLLL